MKVATILIFSFLINITSAQTIKSVAHLVPDTTFENIHIQKITSDSLSTTFAIWVKLKVKVHKHINHVENVYILKGKGDFIVSDSIYKVEEGDLIVVPKNTWHGVKVTSETTMKVISIQSPEFKGKDRVFKEN